jgi:carbon monoxide dehydrogenase subunit G
MRIENSFEVQAPPERAWDLLMDVPRIIPCMPGAELTETVDESTWKAKVSVKLGPISLAFDSEVRRVEADEAARKAKIAASAREVRGRGSAEATIESTLAPTDQGTRVEIVTNLTLVGAVAQYGRGIVPDVATQLVRQFASCLERQLASDPEEPEPEAHGANAQPVKPVSGLSLGFRALVGRLGRLFRQSPRT